MRTIDADAFDATMYEAWMNCEITNEEWFHFREMIKAEPTIEPQRMRGRWIDKSEGRIEGAWPYCSVCDDMSVERFDFCPNCGADMRGTE